MSHTTFGSFYKTDVDLIPPVSLTDKCLVLDLDETLVHTLEKVEWIKKLKIYSDPNAYTLRNRTYKLRLEDIVDEKGEGVISELAGILRPHLREFVIFAFFYFKVVCVWSAGKQKYVHEIARIIFGDISHPNLIFSFNECKEGPKGIEKPLEYIFNVPGLIEYMNLKNTFIIDDRIDCFVANPNNGIVIPAYDPVFTVKGLQVEDNALVQLMIWFLQPEVIYSRDIRNLDKTNIFKEKLNTVINFDLEFMIDQFKNPQKNIRISNVGTPAGNVIVTRSMS
jgi:hypothetical protein